MKYCVQKNESLISFSFLRDSWSKLGPLVTKSSRFSPTFYINIISPCPKDVSNSHLATYNTLIYIVGLYSTQKNTTMTLLMMILSPYHGPELRVHFVYHTIFQFSQLVCDCDMLLSAGFILQHHKMMGQICSWKCAHPMNRPPERLIL